MIEHRIGPQVRVVTLLASLGEAGSHVVGIRCSLEVFQVAADTSGRRQVVVVVDVAIRTLPRRYRVHPGQCKTGAGVVESRVEPRSRVVALLASLGEVRRRVVRVRRALIILQVARDARRVGNVVVVVDMAICALSWRDGVHSRQGEGRLRVVKRSRLPCRGAMANLASLRKSRLHVIRVGRTLKIFQVAGNTGRAGQVVVIIEMSIGALSRWHRVHPR